MLRRVVKILDVLTLFFLIKIVNSQYSESSPQYKEYMADNTQTLVDIISSNPDVNLFFHPDRQYTYADYYVQDLPNLEYYRNNILIDPCRHNNYNCCMNVFGAAEYPSLKLTPWEQERVYKPLYLASDTDVMVNYNLVYEDGSSISEVARRGADDNSIIDYECIARNNPYTYCIGKNYANERSFQRPACNDNNYSLNALDGCYSNDGVYSERCVQIGFTQDAFIPQCVDDTDPHCGTFLEIHMRNGSPYHYENQTIASVRIDTRNVSGVYTTTIPLTWMGNSSKVLCSYSESFLRIGSLVYILSTAPRCCCPGPFNPNTRIGSFFCPLGPNGDGPYAYHSKTLTEVLLVDTNLLSYPFCPDELSGPDRLMCSTYDPKNRRHYVRNCSLAYQSVANKQASYTSIDMVGIDYYSVCPYFDSCAVTLDSGKCRGDDLQFTFVGRVGLVTALDDVSILPRVWVSFNDGRTSYEFLQSDVMLEYYKSMYEIWWVVRTPSYYVLQNRKGFNVTYPQCTLDLTNDRYFPFAQIDVNGNAIDSSLVF